MADTNQADLTTLTVELLSAFLSNNTVDSGDLSGLIQTTHNALTGLNAPPRAEPETPEFTPAVSVRKSLASSDHLISMIDGKPYKMLKRHLKTHGLTPVEYRSRYSLPANYPMVSKNYSEARRNVAEKLGLGRKVMNGQLAANAPAVADAQPLGAAPSTPGKTIRARTAAPKPIVNENKSEPAPARTKTRKPNASGAASASDGVKTSPKLAKADKKTAGRGKMVRAAAPAIALDLASPAETRARTRKTLKLATV